MSSDLRAATAGTPAVTAALCAEAVVSDVLEAGRVRARWVRPGTADAYLAARLAVPGYRPQPGDRVVVAPARDADGYVIGVVAAAEMPAHLAVRRDGGRTVVSVPGELVLEAPEVTVSGERALSLRTAGELRARAERAEWVVGRWDLSADRVRERVRDVYREIEGTLSTRAKRLRSVVKGTAQLLAGRTSIRSRGDTSVDGERVLLG